MVWQHGRGPLDHTTGARKEDHICHLDKTVEQHYVATEHPARTKLFGAQRNDNQGSDSCLERHRGGCQGVQAGVVDCVSGYETLVRLGQLKSRRNDAPGAQTTEDTGGGFYRHVHRVGRHQGELDHHRLRHYRGISSKVRIRPRRSGVSCAVENNVRPFAM